MVQEHIDDGDDKIEREIEEAQHPLEKLIEQRPLEAVIVSVLIGVVLGRLLL